MPSPQNAIPPQSKFKGKTRRFWDRVSEGMALHELWSQFAKDARSSYRFYSAGLDQLETQPSRMRRFWQFSKAMFWAILEKLTPARRILLLVGLALLFFSAGITYGDKSGEVHIFELDMRVVGGLVIFLVLLLELADRVVMKRDLEIAKDIQAWLLPGAPLQLPGYQIAYATRPANTVAGDYYDVILRPGREASDNRILFVVADVAGKSIPAAMLMATFQASLRTLSMSGVPLAELIAGINRYSCSNSQGGARYTTAFLAELDPAHAAPGELAEEYEAGGAGVIAVSAAPGVSGVGGQGAGVRVQGLQRRLPAPVPGRLRGAGLPQLNLGGRRGIPRGGGGGRDMARGRARGMMKHAGAAGEHRHGQDWSRQGDDNPALHRPPGRPAGAFPRAHR